MNFYGLKAPHAKRMFGRATTDEWAAFHVQLAVFRLSHGSQAVLRKRRQEKATPPVVRKEERLKRNRAKRARQRYRKLHKLTMRNH